MKLTALDCSTVPLVPGRTSVKKIRVNYGTASVGKLSVLAV